MGDFNAGEDEPCLHALAGGGWIDAWHHANPDARGGTWRRRPLPAPRLRLGPPGAGWKITDCTRTPVSGSDHVGLLARVSWPSE